MRMKNSSVETKTTHIVPLRGNKSWLLAVYICTHIQFRSLVLKVLSQMPQDITVEVSTESVCESINQVWGTVCSAPGQDCIEAEIWGRAQKNFCCIEGPSKLSPALTTNGESMESPELFLKLVVQPIWPIMVVKEVAKDPMLTLTELSHIMRNKILWSEEIELFDLNAKCHV